MDPLGFAAGDGNLSRYVGNSPTAFHDPSGLIWSWAMAGIGAASGAVIGAAGYVIVGTLTGQEITTGGMLGAAAQGAIVGGVVGGVVGAATGDPSAIMVAGAAAGLGAGIVGGATGSVIQQSVDEGTVSGKQVVFSAAIGGLTGMIGGGLSGGLSGLSQLPPGGFSFAMSGSGSVGVTTSGAGNLAPWMISSPAAAYAGSGAIFSQANGPGNESGTNPISDRARAGHRSYNLPEEYTARIDMSTEAEGGYHIHIYDANGNEVARVNGFGGYSQAHGGSPLGRPSELPPDVRNAINRIIRNYPG